MTTFIPPEQLPDDVKNRIVAAAQKAKVLSSRCSVQDEAQVWGELWAAVEASRTPPPKRYVVEVRPPKKGERYLYLWFEKVMTAEDGFGAARPVIIEEVAP